jgi:hypothetical protein
MPTDDLDHVLTELTQILGNISFVLQTIRALRSNANRLRPMLADELRELHELIPRVVTLL